MKRLYAEWEYREPLSVNIETDGKEMQKPMFPHMSYDQTEFAVFCIEELAEKLGFSSREVYQLLAVKTDLLQEYILPNYEVLHSQGKEYILWDLKEMLEECGVM